jgi:hypothetical protein
MQSSFLTWVSLAGIFLHTALVVVLFRKRLWRKCPVFTQYLLVNLLFNAVLFSLLGSGSLYFYSYVLTQLIAFMFGFGVVLEVFGQLFAPYPSLKKLALRACCWMALVLVVFGGLVTYAQRPLANSMVAFFTAEKVVRIIQAGLVAFLFLFARLFRLHWRQLEFGIALGMGTYAAIELVAVTLCADLGSRAWYTGTILTMIAFYAGWLIWLGYMLLPRLDQPTSS